MILMLFLFSGSDLGDEEEENVVVFEGNESGKNSTEKSK